MTNQHRFRTAKPSSRASAILGLAIALTVSAATAQTLTQGPSSSRTPYLVSTAPAGMVGNITSIVTTTDLVHLTGGGPGINYEVGGLPDGMGAYDNGDGTFTLLLNHEIPTNLLGVVRAHGTTGAWVSELIIDKTTLAVVSASDLMRDVIDGSGVVHNAANTNAIGFGRFCAGDLPEVSAYYNAASGLGSQERIWMHGEEGPATGWNVATVATGPSKGRAYLLPKFNLSTNGSGLTGVGAWENSLANPFPQDLTVVIGTNDGGTGIMNNTVAVYVGTKQATGSEVDKAGLTNGTLQFVNVVGNPVEIVNSTSRATNITNGTRFSLSGTTSTVFSRPEDGAWNPANPRQFYFNTTDRLDNNTSTGPNPTIGATGTATPQTGMTRVWRLTFDDLSNPSLGGVIDLVIDGQKNGVKLQMLDNMGFTPDGKLYLNEDPGNSTYLTKIWFYDPSTDALTQVAKADPSRWGELAAAGGTPGAIAPYTNDKETSGILDVTRLFTASPGPGEAYVLTTLQDHSSNPLVATTSSVEGGQILLLHVNPAATVQFLGVSAGDVTSNSAVVWTRAVAAAAPASMPLTLEVSTSSNFTSGVVSYQVATDAAKDYTAKFEVPGLQAATRYYYRFQTRLASSNVGSFKTAPAASTPAPVRLAFSGDCDGLMRPYPLASVFPTLDLDYFVFLGDTIYETASTGSAAVTSSGTVPGPTATGATPTQLFADYTRKYREQFFAVNAGGQECLKPLFASQANYTLLDNHELGNKQYINGGAPAGGTVGGMASGAGVDARVATNDVNTSGTYMNQAQGFQTLQQVYVDYQPIKDRGVVNAPVDPRTNGTKQLYFAQQWGRNSIFVNVDDRSYRDIRMKTAANADDTSSPRADNPGRTMLGATQLAWLEQTLLAARDAGVTWKIVAVSSPIDQLGPIGGSLPGVGNGVASDGGKSWMGGYRAERNTLLRFLAEHHIENVVFLSTDDHQNRVNELLYSPAGQTDLQSSYVPVPRCFSIVCGPLGATGPDTITDHSFANISSIAAGLAAAQATAGLDPLGLSPNYPGLHDVVREHDSNANLTRSAVDFYSPDTFNIATLDVSANGATLTVAITGIDSRPTNSFGEYDPVNNPVRQVLSFQVDAFTPCASAPCGQFNSTCGSLVVNGVGQNAQGPLNVVVPVSGNLGFDWSGPAGMPLALGASPMLVPGQRPFGAAVVDLELGSMVALFSAFDPLWGSLFFTDAQGRSAQSFRVPAALHGGGLNVQGIVFDATNACSVNGFMTTASFAIGF